MINLKSFLDLDNLQEIQDLFSNATGLAAIALDADGNYITEGSNFTDFCMKYTRNSKEGLKRCKKCDIENTGVYYCHAGLMDFSEDLIINGECVGSIIGGQVLPIEANEDKFRKIARELGINEEEYIDALTKVPVRSESSIRCAAKLLGDTVNQLINLKYMESVNENKVKAFNEEFSNTNIAVNQIRIKIDNLKRLAQKEKILAINASIEASRAGESGKGFSVVANEFSKLVTTTETLYGEISSVANTMIKDLDNLNKVYAKK